MIKILVSCANGAGSSLMLKMTIEKVMKELGIQYQIHHCPISEGKSIASKYDYIFTSMAFMRMFENVKGDFKLIGIKNVMGAQEVKEKFQAAQTSAE